MYVFLCGYTFSFNLGIYILDGIAGLYDDSIFNTWRTVISNLNKEGRLS